MEVNIKKVIWPDFRRNILDGRGDWHDYLTLVDPDMNLPQ